MELLRQPGAGGLGVPLTGSVACSALPLREATVLPILVTGAPGGGLPSSGRAGFPPGGARPGWGPRALLQEEARGRGRPRSLTWRQVFVYPESTVNSGVSLPRSVLCSFLSFLNACCNLNLRLTPVQFRGDNSSLCSLLLPEASC